MSTNLTYLGFALLTALMVAGCGANKNELTALNEGEWDTVEEVPNADNQIKQARAFSPTACIAQRFKATIYYGSAGNNREPMNYSLDLTSNKALQFVRFARQERSIGFLVGNNRYRMVSQVKGGKDGVVIAVSCGSTTQISGSYRVEKSGRTRAVSLSLTSSIANLLARPISEVNLYKTLLDGQVITVKLQK